MRYLGIDYGAKQIGLALSSEGIAFPRGVIANDRAVLKKLVDIVEREKVTHIIVGDTRSFGGRENLVTKDAEAFIEKVKRETELPVVSAEESGSSAEAARYALKEKRDDAAAALILQRYLDTQPKST